MKYLNILKCLFIIENFEDESSNDFLKIDTPKVLIKATVSIIIYKSQSLLIKIFIKHFFIFWIVFYYLSFKHGIRTPYTQFSFNFI